MTVQSGVAWQPINTFNTPRVLLCEGLDECAVMKHLTSSWSPGEVTIAWKQDWRSDTATLLRRSPEDGIRSIGFIFDAEDGTNRHFEEIKLAFDAVGAFMPIRPCVSKKSRVLFWTLSATYLRVPAKGRGMLEDLFMRQMKASPIWPCVESFGRCFHSNPPHHETKLLIRSFLAWHNGYNTQLGLAIRDGHLSCSGSEFDSLRRFANAVRAV